MSNISRVKIVVSALILGASLAFSFLMIFSSSPTVNDSEKSAEENFVDPLAKIQNPIQWAENRVIANNANLTQNNANNNDEENNFTKNLMETVANRVQAGSFGEQGVNQTFPSNKEINKKFELRFIESLKDSEIKISQNNSKEAKTKYLELLGEVAKKNYGDYKKNPLEVVVAVYQDLNPLPAKEAEDIYKNTATDFLNIEVPINWKNFHKDLIIYFKNGAIIYEAMAEYHKDPIKGYMAIEKAQEIIFNKGVEMNEIWQEKYSEI